jgi:hypothetical protein
MAAGPVQLLLLSLSVFLVKGVLLDPACHGSGPGRTGLQAGAGRYPQVYARIPAEGWALGGGHALPNVRPACARALDITSRRRPC